MTRKEIFLTLVGYFPDHTGNELWELLWGPEDPLDHPMRPCDPWPTLDALAKEGKIIRVKGKNRTSLVRWRLA